MRVRQRPSLQCHSALLVPFACSCIIGELESICSSQGTAFSIDPSRDAPHRRSCADCKGELRHEGGRERASEIGRKTEGGMEKGGRERDRDMNDRKCKFCLFETQWPQ